MASKVAQKRLTREYVAMQKEPPPFIWAIPDEKNVLTWDYIIRGPPDSPYAGGEYHGQLMFPSEYPFKPPGIKMITPSGRFQPDKKICFSMSDFHPGTWNPAWSVATILTGLLSFMLSDEMTTGSVNSPDGIRRAYAARSHGWNLTQPRFREVFPEFCTPTTCDLPNMGQMEKRASPSSPRTATPTTTISATTTTTASTKPVVDPPPPPQTTSGSGTPPAALAPPPPTPLGHTATATRATAGKIITTSTPSGTATADKRGEAQNAAVWATSWSQLLWEKWRWGALIVLAVLVSRFSSTT